MPRKPGEADMIMTQKNVSIAMQSRFFELGKNGGPSAFIEIFLFSGWME